MSPPVPSPFLRRRRQPQLVDDVLVHVFSYLSFEDRVAVSHASARFRDVVTHVSAFWTEIDIRSGSDASVHRLSTLLARTASQPIDVCVRAPRLTRQAADIILPGVAAHLHRMRALTLQLSVRHRSALLSALVAPAPLLQSATVCFYDSPSDDPWDLVADELPPALFAGCAPALRRAAFDAVYLPPEGVPVLARVRDLTVEYSVDAGLDFAALPRHFPDTEAFGVAIGLHYADLAAIIPGPGFANLQTLTLYMTADRALSSPCFTALLSYLQFHDIPEVAIHYRGAPPAADLAAYLDPTAFSGGPVAAAISFVYARAPPPLGRHAAHTVRDVAFSVALCDERERTRTLTAWYDLSPPALSHGAALAPRMLREALTPQVTALEVCGSAAWDVLAAAAATRADLRGVVDLTFVPQPPPADPTLLFPRARVRFPALRTVQLRSPRAAAAHWPAFLRTCIGADLRPPPYQLTDPALSP